MASKITYTNKEYLINDNTVPAKNKVLDTDMNEIKQVVNNNADELDTATNNIATNTQDISDIKQEQITQNDNIQTNARDISALTGRVETNETNITNLQNNKVDKVAGKGLSTNDFTNEYKEQIDTNKNNILLRALITETGSIINLNLNTSNYKLKAILKDKNNNVISTSNEIDLPIESMIINATYDSSTKEIVLTLQNGNTIRFSVADLIGGLQQEITSSNKLASDLVDDTNQTNKFVTTSEKFTWNSKYAKPSGGIPKTDLDSSVQTSLGKADSALQEHQDITGKEDKSNKVTSMSSESTDTQYPSAKAVHDRLVAQDAEITELQQDNTNLLNALPEVTGEGSNIVLQGTSKNKYKTPPLPAGNSEQVQLTGKNFFDKDTVLFTAGILDDNGNPTASSSSHYTENFYEVKENTDYTLSGTLRQSTSGIRIYYYTTNKEWIQRTNQYSTDIVNFTTPVNCNYIRIQVAASITLETGDVQLEEGSSATAYEPYCGGISSPNPTYKQDIHNVSGDVEVTVGNKNLFDKTTVTSNKYIDDADGNAKNASNLNASDYIYIKGIENIRISSSMTGSQWGAFYDKNKQYISGFNSYLSAKTVPTNAYYMRITVSNSALSNMQVEPGTTATSYVPHEQQTYAFTLEQGQKMYKGDYLADDGIHHVRGEVVLDETSDIVSIQSNATTGNTTFVIRGVNGLKKGSYIAPLCNQLAGSSSSDYRNFKNQIVQWTDTSASFALGMDTSVVGTSKSNIQDYLENNPLIIEAFLAEEVITPYTETQQAQYNAIKKAMSYKDTTVITLTSDDANPLTNVVAVADMSNFNPSEIDEIKTAIVALGGVI